MLYLMPFVRYNADASSRTRWIVDITVLATCCLTLDRSTTEGKEFTPHGRNWPSGPVCQDLCDLQRPAHPQEEDTHQKANTKSRFQRKLRFRHSHNRGKNSMIEKLILELYIIRICFHRVLCRLWMELVLSCYFLIGTE